MGNILSCRVDEYRVLEQEREEGQALLRSMVLSSEEVDWAAVIAKAHELHAKEQAWLRQQSRRQRRIWKRQQRKSLQKRKKYDSCGSFSVNMLTFRPQQDEEQGVKASNTSSVGTLSHDEQSYGSFSAGWGTKSYDEGMEVIDEDRAL